MLEARCWLVLRHLLRVHGLHVKQMSAMVGQARPGRHGIRKLRGVHRGGRLRTMSPVRRDCAIHVRTHDNVSGSKFLVCVSCAGEKEYLLEERWRLVLLRGRQSREACLPAI